MAKTGKRCLDVVARTDSRQRLRLWIRLAHATRHVEGELRERLRREAGTTLPRFDVLAALNRADRAMMMTELSRFLMVSNGNVTGIVDRLVEDGLVIRTQKENDRRTTCVQLTKSGKAAFVTLAAAHETWVDELLAPIDMGETAELIDMLTRFNNRFRCNEAHQKEKPR